MLIVFKVIFCEGTSILDNICICMIKLHQDYNSTISSRIYNYIAYEYIQTHNKQAQIYVNINN